MNFSIRVTELFVHTTNEISTILKFTFQTYQKRQGFTLFLNVSIRVTEHFVHTFKEISIILKFTFEKYKTTTRISIIIETFHRCHESLCMTWSVLRRTMHGARYTSTAPWIMHGVAFNLLETEIHNAFHFLFCLGSCAGVIVFDLV